MFTFIDRFTVGFFIGIFPILLTVKYAATPSTIGMYQAMLLLPFALLSPISGMLSDRIGRAVPLVAGSLFYGAGVATLGYAGPHALMILMIACGVLAALMYAPSIALTGDLAPPGKRGAAMGGFNSFGSIGMALGPITGGIIADTWGLEASFTAAGATEVLIALTAIPFLLRITAQPAPEDALEATGEENG